jgi:hypothetical protein
MHILLSMLYHRSISSEISGSHGGEYEHGSTTRRNIPEDSHHVQSISDLMQVNEIFKQLIKDVFWKTLQISLLLPLILLILISYNVLLIKQI